MEFALNVTFEDFVHEFQLKQKKTAVREEKAAAQKA